MPKEALAVEIPAEGRDKPAWVKVGVIAAVGFVVGIAWPRLVGLRLGPSAPAETSASARAARAPEAPPASVSAKIAASAAPSAAAPVASAAAPSHAAPPSITVQKGTVVSCKTTDGETKKGAACGAAPGVDALVTPRVRKIATCSGVEGQTGKLGLVVNADFASGRFWYEVAKSTTLQNVDAVSSCLKTAFHGTSTTATPHEHARYTVSYVAVFGPGGAAVAEAADEKPAPHAKNAKEGHDTKDEGHAASAPANAGEAEVAWEVALVRDTPKTGGLVSRLPRGSKVKVGTSKDGWYQIKFGDGFASEGWVYRGAIGR